MSRAFTLRCPECAQECWWCSWTVALARESGCGARDSKTNCEKAQALKGTKCGTCDGSGVVTATINTASTEASNG